MIPYIKNASQIQQYLDLLTFKPATESLETLQTLLAQIFDLANVNDVDEVWLTSRAYYSQQHLVVQN
ncbi:22294_t:CDS:2 [Gigaspora rosea]|nr:22294_t:CDS:2 [Gigaspora rosea]